MIEDDEILREPRPIDPVKSESGSVLSLNRSDWVASGEAVPNRVTARYFRELLVTCARSGASDITLQSDQQPRVEIDGDLFRIGRRPWTPSEVEMVLVELYHAANAIAEIKARKVLDFSYEIGRRNGIKWRFRVNATGVHAWDGSGIEITLRVLPSETPDSEFVSLSEQEVSTLTPRSGLVVIAGATGSGKSATMAALTRHHLESVSSPVKIVDIQSPIEYTFRDVSTHLKGSSSIIGQSEVGRHIPGFAAGVRSALRRKPHIINVGEARDLETIRTSLEAALTGHLVYTTTHAGSVADCVRRLLSAFPVEEREHRASDLGTSLRFIMVQHLVPRIGGGRVPVREYLRFSGGIRTMLLRRPSHEWPGLILEIMECRASNYEKEFMQRLDESAASLVKNGKIVPSVAERLIEAAPSPN